MDRMSYSYSYCTFSPREKENSYCLFIISFPLRLLNKLPGLPAPKNKREKKIKVESHAELIILEKAC